MDISSVSNASFSRSVTPSKSSSDRQSNDESQAATVEKKVQERAQQHHAVQEKRQQDKDENERRLDGRLISFGHEKSDVSNPQKQASFNRSRVNEAYSAPKNESTNIDNKHTQRSHEPEVIDIVV